MKARPMATSKYSTYGIPYTITVKDVRPEFWKQFKKEADRKGTTTGELAEQILERWLSEQNGDR
jgi:hypothetical protein